MAGKDIGGTLSVSNLGWDDGLEPLLNILNDLGVSSVELAPLRLGPTWRHLSPTLFSEVGRKCRSFNIRVSGFQAIFYKKPDCQLFGPPKSYQKFKNHLKLVSELAAEASSPVLVFGAPGNRSCQALAENKVTKLEVERFTELAEICAEFDVSLVLESVPSQYGSDYLVSYKDVLTLVSRVAHPNLGVHLDTACVSLAGDSVAASIRETSEHLSYFHISEPNLSNFATPSAYHFEAAKTLSEIEYPGTLSIEMLPDEEPEKSIRNAVAFVRSIYAAALRS